MAVAFKCEVSLLGPKMLNGFRLVTTATTTPTTTLQSQGVINTTRAPATATISHFSPLEQEEEEEEFRVSASAAMCRPPLCKCRLSSGQTAHCNLHLNDPSTLRDFSASFAKILKKTPK